MAQSLEVVGVNWEIAVAKGSSLSDIFKFFDEYVGIVVERDYELWSDNGHTVFAFMECLKSLRRQWQTPSSEALFAAFGAVSGWRDYGVMELNLPQSDLAMELPGDFILSALSPETVARLTDRWNEVDFSEARDYFGLKQANMLWHSSAGVEVNLSETFNDFVDYLESWRFIFRDAAPKGIGIVVWSM